MARDTLLPTRNGTARSGSIRAVSNRVGRAAAGSIHGVPGLGRAPFRGVFMFTRTEAGAPVAQPLTGTNGNGMAIEGPES